MTWIRFEDIICPNRSIGQNELERLQRLCCPNRLAERRINLLKLSETLHTHSHQPLGCIAHLSPQFPGI